LGGIIIAGKAGGNMARNPGYARNCGKTAGNRGTPLPAQGIFPFRRILPAPSLHLVENSFKPAVRQFFI
jgi:hypothetical protein